MLKTKDSGQSGTRILLEAMSKDQIHLAKFVLDALDGEIVDCKTDGAKTPLISSVLLPDGRTRCKFIELLLQKGARVNRQDENGRTALSYASEKGHLDAVKVLVRHNADPEIVDSWGNTALMYAAVAGHCQVVEFLVRAFRRLGLQIDKQNKAGNSAVQVARFLGHTHCVSALTNFSQRSCGWSGGAQGHVGPQPCLGNEFERKVGNLANKLELLQTCDHAAGPLLMQQKRLPSMDFIEEFEREREGSCSHLTPVRTFAPPTRTHNQSLHTNQPKLNERLCASDHYLPPLQHSGEIQNFVFSSRPYRNTPHPSSALGILLTPFGHKYDSEAGTDRPKVLDSEGSRLSDSYYKKRCSLPTTMLGPTPPERTLLPERKSKTARRRLGSISTAAPPELTSPAAASTATTLSVLSSKLFRRFTSPEFKNDALELDPVSSGRIPRSETFPQAARHPQVDSTPSIDSISSVKCEFDFQFGKPNF